MTRDVPQGVPSSPILFNMYIDALATAAEASQCVCGGNGAIIMVADDVLLQAKSKRRHLQVLLYMASDWQREKGARWSISMCSYLQIHKRTEVATLSKKRLKEADSEICLRMPLGAHGLQGNNSTKRAKNEYRDLSILLKQKCWSLRLPARQLAVLFNTFVRSKYRYGLRVTAASKEVAAYDDKLEEAVFRGFLKTRTQIKGRGKRKTQALLQFDRLQWLTERAAGGR